MTIMSKSFKLNSELQKNDNVGNMSLDKNEGMADVASFIDEYFPSSSENLRTIRFSWALSNLSVNLMNSIKKDQLNYNKDNIVLGVAEILKQNRYNIVKEFQEAQKSNDENNANYIQKLIYEVDKYLGRDHTTWYDKDEDAPEGILLSWGEDTNDNDINQEFFNTEISSGISGELREKPKKIQNTDVNTTDVFKGLGEDQGPPEEPDAVSEIPKGMMMGLFKDVKQIPINDLDDLTRKLKLSETYEDIVFILEQATRFSILTPVEITHLNMSLQKGNEYVMPSLEFIINIRKLSYNSEDDYIMILDSHLASLKTFDKDKGNLGNKKMESSIKDLSIAIQEIRQLVFQANITTEKLDTTQRNLLSIKPHPNETPTNFADMASTPKDRGTDRTVTGFIPSSSTHPHSTIIPENQKSKLPTLNSVNKPRFIKDDSDIFVYQHNGKIYKYNDTSTNKNFKEIISNEEFILIQSERPHELEDIFFKRLLDTTS
nr:MAG: hypothetical protein [Rhabdoviridae sp.]